MFDDIKSSTAFQRFKRATQPIHSFILKFRRDWSLTFAGMIAYNLLVALVPMAIATLGIIGLVLRRRPVVQKSLTDPFVTSAPSGTFSQTVIQQVINLAIMELETDSSSLLILGIFFAILGASRLFIAIDRSFTIIYRLPERSMLRRNGMAMGMVLIFLIPFALLIAANLSSSLIVGGNQNISDRPGIYILGFLCSLLAAFILFEIIYLLIPNKKMSLKVTWCGALIASFLFEIVIIWFPLYAQTNTKSYTGIVGFIIVLILSLYYFGLMLNFGAQINAYCFEHYRPHDSGIATLLSEFYDKYGDGDSRKPLVAENAAAIQLQYQ